MPTLDRQAIIRKVRELQLFNPLFLDTETTGLGSTAEIVEIAVLDSAGEILLNTLVKPTRPIPPDAIRVHGITDAAVAQAPAWVEVWPQLSSILRGKKVGVYNDEFDVRMIQQTNQLARLAQPVPAASFFCIMRLYADFSGVRRFQALDVVGRQLGIPLPNAHRALADALLAREVFLRMAQSGRL